ncbi:hypothetical protein SCHPADRAFT_891376 [Schizopora paradoxa]|uniref:Uncharacterized protein n=1 Tax=Schizopora paradoxa TaxID=27342 RepID=A0A0H2RJ77_9AGAM|nr:hypothetical protein SCHPADRAFT_891376 [Schizopora paradoxa]
MTVSATPKPFAPTYWTGLTDGLEVAGRNDAQIPRHGPFAILSLSPAVVTCRPGEIDIKEEREDGHGVSENDEGNRMASGIDRMSITRTPSTVDHYANASPSKMIIDRQPTRARPSVVHPSLSLRTKYHAFLNPSASSMDLQGAGSYSKANILKNRTTSTLLSAARRQPFRTTYREHPGGYSDAPFVNSRANGQQCIKQVHLFSRAIAS